MGAVTIVSPILRRHWESDKVFQIVAEVRGQTFRALESRRTLRFELDGKGFFLKHHQGVAPSEFVKNFLTLRMPILGAGNEYRAIRKLTSLGIKTPVVAAYGWRGWRPWALESFLVTEALDASVSLEDLCAAWRQSPPAPGLKRHLIAEVARISRVMHGAGVCHRDYYLCHFLLEPNGGSPVLIDLHRALIKSRLRQRWRVKDVGGLYFSAMDAGLRRSDLLRFIRVYGDKGLRHELENNQKFWNKVQARALATYREEFNREPDLPWLRDKE